MTVGHIEARDFFECAAQRCGIRGGPEAVTYAIVSHEVYSGRGRSDLVDNLSNSCVRPIGQENRLRLAAHLDHVTGSVVLFLLSSTFVNRDESTVVLIDRTASHNSDLGSAVLNQSIDKEDGATMIREGGFSNPAFEVLYTLCIDGIGVKVDVFGEVNLRPNDMKKAEGITRSEGPSLH
jgi:hypothetical protein